MLSPDDMTVNCHFFHNTLDMLYIKSEAIIPQEL